MLLKKSRILYDEVKTGDTGGAGGSNNAPPPTPSPTPTPNSAPPSTEGIKFDDFGFEIKQEVVKAEVPKEEGITPDPKAQTPPSDIEINTGYEAPVEPPKEEVIPPAELPPTPPPVEDKDKVVTDFGNLSEADKKVLGDYFEKHKLPKEARDEMVALKKSEISNQLKAQQDQKALVEKETAKLKSTWYNELKNDKEFGGTNFDANIKMVNRLVGDFMPNVKKMLTDKGGMLPPGTMKDFHFVAKKLYETEKMVQGDPGTSETSKPGKFDFLNDYYGKTN